MMLALTNRIAAALLLLGLANAAPARPALEEITPDPAALKAFTQVVESYRARPALLVKSTVKITLSEGEHEATGSEVKGEFLFGRDRQAVIKLRGFTVYLSNDGPDADAGVIAAVHDGSPKAYFSASDDGSPYYALLVRFHDLPFPELAIMLGEDDIDDVLLQFHPKAINGLTPTAVKTHENNGKPRQVITLTGEDETLEMAVDPATKLIQEIELKIAGGPFVQEGVTLTYSHRYEYETHEKPLEAQTFRLDPGQREKVDLMMALTPQRARPGAEDEDDAQAALVGQPAPAFVLSTADGRAIDLEDLRDRVVVLDFWASWCGPCLAALPRLHEVAKWAAQEDLPVTVLTVNVWEIRDPQKDNPDVRLASATDTWKKRNFTLPIVMDYTDETAESYGLRGIPTTVVIRSDGIVHTVHVGAGPSYVEDLKRDIQEALHAVE